MKIRNTTRKISTKWTNHRKLFIMTGAGFLAHLGSVHASPTITYDQLTEKQQDQIALGNQVRISEPNPDSHSPFDKLTVFLRVNATPLESAAVFTQYNRHKDFFKDMLESRIENGAITTPDTEIIDYTIQVNVFGLLHFKESYTVSDLLVAESSVPGGYSVSWKMIKPGENTSNAEGYVHFEPYGEQSTLITYSNAITPRSTFITRPFLYTSLAKDFAASTLYKIVDNLKSAIEKEKATRYDDLQEKVAELEKELHLPIPTPPIPAPPIPTPPIPTPPIPPTDPTPNARK